jgi:hypothetical protein
MQKGTRMKYSRIFFAAAVAVAACAAQAQVGPHGDVGGTPQAAQAGAPPDAPKRPVWLPKNPLSSMYNQIYDFHSIKTREQVRAELMQGREMLLAYEGFIPNTGYAFVSRPRVVY